MSPTTAEWIEAFEEAFRQTSPEMLEEAQLLDVIDLGDTYFAVVTIQSGRQFAQRFSAVELDDMTPSWMTRLENAHSLVIGDALGSQSLSSRRSSLPLENLYPDAIWSGSGPGIGEFLPGNALPEDARPAKRPER